MDTDEKTKRGSWVSKVAAGVLIAALGGVALLQGIQEAKGGGLVETGTPAPAATFERYGGGEVSLEALRGKVVMLDFWATWCGPCVEEMPMLTRVAKEYADKGVVFVAASRDDPEEAKAAVGVFIAQRSPDLAPFAAYATDPVARSFKVNVLPTLYVLDAKGQVVAARSGVISEPVLRSALDRALAAN